LVIVTGIWLIAMSINQNQGESGRIESKGSNSDWQSQLVQQAERRLNSSPEKPLPFAALNKRAEAVPRRFVRKAIENLGGHQRLGLRFRRAHYLHTSVGVGIWIVPGRNVTCLFQAVEMAAACSINTIITRKGEVLVVGRRAAPDRAAQPVSFLAVGIAPNWVRAILMKPIGKPSRRVPVVNNTYGLRARSPINIEKLIR